MPVETLWTLAACAAYFVLLLVTRWFIVAREDRELLREHIARLRAELTSLPPGDKDSSTVSSVEALLNEARLRMGDERLPYILMWGGAYESSAWYCLHDAKLLLAALWPWPRVEVRLLSAVQELSEEREPRKDEGHALSLEIKRFLDPLHGKAQPTFEQEAEGRVLLQRALRIIYSQEGNDDQEVRAWHNKIMWISCCSLVLIAGLAAALGQPKLFLLGATGGFMSRLAPLRRRRDIAKGYSAYWTTLFVSPLIGALAGWTGVLVASILVEENILGSGFSALKWDAWTGPNPQMLAAAFLFGFSEGFFDEVIRKRVSTAFQKEDAAPNKPKESKPRNPKPHAPAAPSPQAES